MRPTLLMLAGLASCAAPPQSAPGQILGYGTPGVSAFLPPGTPDTLENERAYCRAHPPAPVPHPQSADAACDQLGRTLRNQPGNS